MIVRTETLRIATIRRKPRDATSRRKPSRLQIRNRRLDHRNHFGVEHLLIRLHLSPVGILHVQHVTEAVVECRSAVSMRTGEHESAARNLQSLLNNPRDLAHHFDRHADQVERHEHRGLAFGISNRGRPREQVGDFSFRCVTASAVTGKPHRLVRSDDDPGNTRLPRIGCLANSVSGNDGRKSRDKDQGNTLESLKPERRQLKFHESSSRAEASIAGEWPVPQHSKAICETSS